MKKLSFLLSLAIVPICASQKNEQKKPPIVVYWDHAQTYKDPKGRAAIEAFCTSGVGINTRDEASKTPAHYAATFGSLWALQQLAAAKADLKLIDLSRNNLLHAVVHGYLALTATKKLNPICIEQPVSAIGGLILGRPEPHLVYGHHYATLNFLLGQCVKPTSNKNGETPMKLLEQKTEEQDLEAVRMRQLLLKRSFLDIPSTVKGAGPHF